MNKKKFLEGLEKRVEAIENELQSIISSMVNQISESEDEALSYKEVINEWLNGPTKS